MQVMAEVLDEQFRGLFNRAMLDALRTPGPPDQNFTITLDSVHPAVEVSNVSVDIRPAARLIHASPIFKTMIPLLSILD